ncbi:hypothetical protein [Micromonospora costi]|uniref:Uncharacterized protein n=1 Tax=Micromonospora costi TaxID=1530042 RepID=A0A3B0A6U3_9ACTN|nr:hypothetical protein [Micromonospora costi]RKN56010.1 hypothetical protein D7193_15610 [Micromonospora costi]
MTTPPTPTRGPLVRDLVADLGDAVEDYERVTADPDGEVNEAAQRVADACVALRKARGWVTR